VAKIVTIIHTLLYVVDWRVGEGTLLATPTWNSRDTDGPIGVSLSIGHFLNQIYITGFSGKQGVPGLSRG